MANCSMIKLPIFLPHLSSLTTVSALMHAEGFHLDQNISSFLTHDAMTQSLGVRDLLFPEERKGSFCLLTLLSLHYETVMIKTVRVPTLLVIHLRWSC